MSKLTFTPSLFYKYDKSPHWIWHDSFTDPELKGEISELAEKLIDQGHLHERDVIADLNVTAVDTDNMDEAVRQTLRLMTEGTELIYQGGLEMTIGDVRYVGRPDLLEKRPGESRFGNYWYAPVDIKSTADLKRPHRQQLTLYALMLETIQDHFPDITAIINAQRQRVPFVIGPKERANTLDVRDRILDILAGTKPSLRLTSSYKETPWFDVCLKDAVDADDIALIYRLDNRSLDGLRNAGICTIHDAAAMDVPSLPRIPYARTERLERAKLQAQSLISNKVIWRTTPTIPDAPLRLYFDIEGDPLLGMDYLFGFWVVEPATPGCFRYFLAEDSDSEEGMWKEFLQWLETLPDEFAVYHYADYERSHLRLLARRYGGSPKLDRFRASLVDLARVVQDTVILPLHFYSIKDIAKSDCSDIVTVSYGNRSWEYDFDKNEVREIR